MRRNFRQARSGSRSWEPVQAVDPLCIVSGRLSLAGVCRKLMRPRFMPSTGCANSATAGAASAQSSTAISAGLPTAIPDRCECRPAGLTADGKLARLLLLFTATDAGNRREAPDVDHLRRRTDCAKTAVYVAVCPGSGGAAVGDP